MDVALPGLAVQAQAGLGAGGFGAVRRQHELGCGGVQFERAVSGFAFGQQIESGEPGWRVAAETQLGEREFEFSARVPGQSAGGGELQLAGQRGGVGFDVVAGLQFDAGVDVRGGLDQPGGEFELAVGTAGQSAGG